MEEQKQSNKQQVEALVARKKELQSQIDTSFSERKTLKLLVILAGGFGLTIFLIGQFASSVQEIKIVFFSVSGLLFLVSGFFSIGMVFVYPADQKNEMKSIDTELEYLQIDEPTPEQKAERLFKTHQIEVKKYYDQTRQQNKSIFYVGVGCICLGILFVIATICIITLKSWDNNDEMNKILISVIGTLSGFISNFVGAIFLKMYSGALKTLTEFHSRLVNTHHLHYASYLATSITDINLKDRTLSRLVSRVSGGMSTPSNT